MKNILGIYNFIIHYNKPLQIPYRLFLAFCYQIYKRTVKLIFAKRIFNGNHIFIYPNCTISSQFIYTDMPDREEIEILRSYCDKNTIFLDIGANVGAYSMMISDVVGGVYAFEPHPFIAGRCKMNFLLNNINESNVKQIALSDKEGEVCFTNDIDVSAMNKISESSNGIKVKTKTLDKFASEENLLVEHDYVLKIDVEGHEIPVLKGAEEFFKTRNIKAFMIEIFDTTFDETKDVIESYGYKLRHIHLANYIATRV